MSIQLKSLPYRYHELEPFVSAETLRIHYEQHHKRYVDNLNSDIENTALDEKGLHEIIRDAEGRVYQNAAQVWNHNFFWQCLTPHGGQYPKGGLLTAIEDEYHSFANFQQLFEHSTARRFGAGWTWLVQLSNGRLQIINTRDADTPATDPNTQPLLVIDVWEHAYYIDYHYRRADYVRQFWYFVNWEFAARNYSQAVS
ncbi:superoxide dismutase [Arenicella chitinivorans]|uniref:Superoxide dismutase n=1 Tax=Arenicella chitinivorans TaxID=1329800 RepID=A0A918VPR0_9GAMM|nr:Fe-Mn family superoxide dismutase [Arenicella chitinivorans]GHA13285.1 superoxide dismutase [Arenicella chitinivorans]